MDEVKERKIMVCAPGSPAPAALHSDKSRTSLANSVPIEDQERHLLVKVIDRVLYKLEDVDHPSAHV